MQNAPPESVTVSGWTAYAAMVTLRRRVRLLEAKRDETTIAADEERELCAGIKALNEIVDCLFPCAEAPEGHDKSGPGCRFSQEELLSFIHYVLPSPTALLPEFETIPHREAASLFRLDMIGLKRELQRTRAMNEAREDAKKRGLNYRLRAFKQRFTRRKIAPSVPHAL